MESSVNQALNKVRSKYLFADIFALAYKKHYVYYIFQNLCRGSRQLAKDETL